jgi:hypothetical protein
MLLVKLASNFSFISGNPLIYVLCTINIDLRRKMLWKLKDLDLCKIVILVSLFWVEKRN